MEALVEYNYDAQEVDELTIRKGDIIKEVKLLNGGWWEGTLREKRGMFPDNFVKLLDSDTRNIANSLINQEEVSMRNGSGRKFCKVLFSYEPCNDDELKLTPEDSIEYLGEVEEGWWKGKIKGRVGLFPSNFVSPPTIEEAHQEICRVKFPYEAANEDELTLVEGDFITLISKDAPDKGWWKGELKGNIGLFPDNFVEMVSIENENQNTDSQPCQILPAKSNTKSQSAVKRKETANARKSLDVRNTCSAESNTKKTGSQSSNLTSHVSTPEKKSPSNNLISSLKRLVLENTNNVSNGNGSTSTGLGGELDNVERGEGAPLSHLTASRAKAPRRRLPSTQHLKHQTQETAVAPIKANNFTLLSVEENIINGNTDVPELVGKYNESDRCPTKSCKKAPWVEELKLNQIERKKVTDKTDRIETKKDQEYSRSSSVNNTDPSIKNKANSDYRKSDEKLERTEHCSPVDQPQLSPLSPPVDSLRYVPYHLFSQLLERVNALEENQITLQKKIHQLTDQLAPHAINIASDEK